METKSKMRPVRAHHSDLARDEFVNSSSQLELEAANFFKLDLSQVNLFGGPMKTTSVRESVRRDNMMDNCERSSSSEHCRCCQRYRPNSRPDAQRRLQECRRPAKRIQANLVQTELEIDKLRTSNATNNMGFKHSRKRTQSCSVSPKSPQHNRSQSKAQAPMFALQSFIGSSSTTATTTSNSLPSVCSSPSVSPSLICPHLSLEDILELRHNIASGSPHTIGLCAKCRLDPPPNVQSPLSPMFRPFKDTGGYGGGGQAQTFANPGRPPVDDCKQLKRGYSDQQASSYSARVNKKAALKSDSGQKLRDDSLDYFLEPQELRRLQMSPTLRNSVEFIRNNPTESGRVVRVYKNGCPYDKPLRVCILRGEFSSLNHLLDYINGRQLIPLGARYLFHLDGQLVYSVHELKHGSSYIVSGVRNFHFRTSSIIKSQLEREQQLQRHNAHSAGDLTSIGAQRNEEKGPLLEYVAPALNQQLAAVSNTLHKDPGEIDPNATFAAKETHRTNGPRGPQPVRGNANSRAQTLGFGGQSAIKSVPASEPNKTISKVTEPIKAQQVRVGITRAKSELSGIGQTKQKKKMVTFVDTGRGSSPAVSEVSSESLRGTVSNVELNGNNVEQIGSEQEPKMKEMNTNDIGIQVSESIDGFLIDLPLELPPKGDDASLTSARKRPREFNASRTITRTGAQASARTLNGKPNVANRGANLSNSKPIKPARKIITITERQLSLDEMSQLKDLDEGDHHSKSGPRVTIELAEERIASDDETKELTKDELDKEEEEEEVVPDRKNTIAIGSERAEAPLESSTSKLVQATVEQAEAGENQNSNWRYPGGRDTSATPTERPVSQSDANEAVRARVTTPTPSLSTTTGGVGDSSSHGATTSGGLARKSALGGHKFAHVKPKQRVEVLGKLFNGLYEPTKNFRLVWVNGFTINDQYPENSFNVRQQLAIEQQQKLANLDQQQQHLGESRTSTPSGGGRIVDNLSPSYGDRLMNANSANLFASMQFKPSERFHNWVCHSRLHDELVYPAGSLVILWCRWTTEQRYYSKHTTNVSTVTLSTVDCELAASAQVCDSPALMASNGKQKPAKAAGLQGAQIHLWSLTTLDTLYIIEDDQVRTKRIFSLKLRNSRSLGCELSVCARDDSKLFLLTFTGNHIIGRDQKKNDSNAQQQQAPAESDKKKITKNNSSSLDEPVAMTCALRAIKPLPNNQRPLVMVPIVQLVKKVETESNEANKKQAKLDLERAQLSPLISIGRRHFHVWAPEKRQQKFRLLQPENKSAKFVESIEKFNCLTRLSPDEFLLGDSEGTVTVLTVNYDTTMQSLSAKKAAQGADTADGLKYSMETITLIGDSNLLDQAQRLDNSQGLDGRKQANNAITCLARMTGNLFACADSSCTIRFYRLQRGGKSQVESKPNGELSGSNKKPGISCHLLKSLSLPSDLGFICSIVPASNYNRRQAMVEFYVVSTSNTVLFGSLNLSETNEMRQETDLEALSVVVEGHETAASSLVADCDPQISSNQANDRSSPMTQHGHYFTCSLDCRICKWNGKQLVWKSLLPSSCASLAMHPVGSVLAVGSIDGTVYILDKVSGLLISYFPLTPVCINCLAYSRDGALLAAGCENGSIFILPVYESGLKYKKVSIFQSPHPVVSLQFSVDSRYILTSVTHGSWQELILWDLPNFRYMRENVKLTADKIEWFDSICSGSEDVRAIWENANLANSSADGQQQSMKTNARKVFAVSEPLKKLVAGQKNQLNASDGFVVNLSCHRLIKSPKSADKNKQVHLMTFDEQSIQPSKDNFVIASDTRGYLRLFRYPCYDIQQGFCAIRISSLPVNCCRFLHSDQADYFVSTSLDGTICLWVLE